MKLWRILTITLISSLSVCLAADAGARDTRVISLKEAIDIALTNNPALKAAGRNKDMMDMEKNIAMSNFLPRCNISQSVMNSDNPVFAFGTLLNQSIFTQEHFDVSKLNNPDAITDHVTSIQIQQPVYNGGMELLGWKSSKIKQEKSREEYEQATEEIIYDVIESYFNVILSKEMLKLSEQSVQTAKANLELIQKLFDNGVVVKSDLLSAKVHLNHLRQQQVSAQYHVSLSLSAFRMILSDDMTDYEVQDEFKITSCPTVILEELEELGITRRSDLRMLIQQKNEAGIGVSQAKGAFLPAVNLQFSYDYHGNTPFSDGEGSYMAGGSVTVNVFRGFGDRARYRQARMMEEILGFSIHSLIDQVKLGIKEAYYNLKSAVDNYSVTEDAIEQAEENLKIVRNRYDQGVATVVELLNAELLLTSARTDRVQALFNCSINHARLCKETGNIRERWETLATGGESVEMFDLDLFETENK